MSRKRGTNAGAYVLLALLIAGMIILLYPAFADSLTETDQTLTIKGYEDTLEKTGIAGASSAWHEADDYNRSVWEKQQISAFMYAGEQYDDPVYDSILHIQDEGNIMAYIQIPLIDASIPVVHGTHADDLKINAGHLHGTSVPVGGVNTHCVIAAHSGLQNAELFTGLEKARQGDMVFIHVLGRTLNYSVEQVVTVLPEDADGYLQIEKGRDLLTLYTCTPYGINSHRLLVKCVRAPDTQLPGTGENSLQNSMRSINAISRCILCVMIPVCLEISGLMMIRRRGKENSESEKTDDEKNNINIDRGHRTGDVWSSGICRYRG